MSSFRPNLLVNQPLRPHRSARRPRRRASAAVHGLYGIGLLVMLANVAFLLVTPGTSVAPVMAAYNALLLVLVIAFFPRSNATPFVVIGATVCMAISVTLAFTGP